MSRALHLFLVTISFAAALFVAATLVHAASDPVNGIIWANVPAEAATTPATTSYGSLDVGKCMCDYTPYVCDANCCCDPDCGSPSSKPAFFATCDRSNGGDNQQLRCIEQTSDALAIVSAPRTQELKRQVWFGEESVCVVDTNLAAREGVEPLYTLPSEADALNLLGDSTAAWPSSSSSTAAASSNSFMAGDLIPIARFDPVTYVASVQPSRKYIPDLGAASSTAAGVCDTANQNDHLVGFMQSTEGGGASDTVACDVSAAALASVCTAGGALSVDVFRYLAVATKDHSLLSKSALVPVNLRIVNSASLAVLETFNVQTVLDRSFDATQPAPAAPVVVTQMVGANCINAVVGTRLTVEYDVSGTGATAVTSITAASLVVLVNTNMAPSATARYRRTFSVRFVRKGSVAAGLSNDVPSALTRRRSGSPGYVAGRPLLAGYLWANSATQQAVLQAPAGFAIPIGGNCLTAPRFGSVPFGHDVDSASCYLDVTQAELINSYCLNGALPTLLNSVLKPSLCGGAACPANVTTVNRIGRDGSAQHNVTADWVTVSGADSLSERPTPFSTQYQSCQLVTGLEWTIGVSRGGATYNPQDVVVAARVRTITSHWAWAPQGAATTTRVRFRFRVRFVRVPAAGTRLPKEVKPPPFFPAVGDDVFYPFKRGNT